MKPTKRRWLAAFFSAAIFLLSLTACTPQVATSSGDEVPSSTPEGTQSEPNASFGYGFDIQFPGSMISEMEGTAVLVREFEYAGGELKANMYLRSKPGQVAELGILIFCEGVPTEYTILDSGETGILHVFQVEGEQTVKISLKPDFDLNLGRIDFHVVPLPSEKESVTMNGVISVHAVLPAGYQAEGTYSDAIGDVEDDRFTDVPENFEDGFTKLYVNDAVGNIFFDPASGDLVDMVPLTYEIEGKEETRISVRVPAPGTYRLVFLLDGEPFALEDGKTVLDCEFGEHEMFSTVLPLKQILSPGSHSLQAIATRLDEQTYQTQASCYFLSSSRVEIIN